MSFVVAVVGGYGVGKSVLTSHLQSMGLISLDVETFIGSYLLPSQNSSIFDMYINHLHKQYHLTYQSEDALLQGRHLYRSLYDFIHSGIVSECEGTSYVVEVPSFIALDELLDVSASLFDYVVAVDCPVEIQLKYLMTQYRLSEPQAKGLISVCKSRYYYMQYSTDIVLNTVEISQLEWVASKLLTAFKAVSIYQTEV